MTQQKGFLGYLSSRRLATVFFLAVVLRATPIVFREVREPGWHERHLDNIGWYYDDVARSLIVGEGLVNPRPECPWQVEPGTPLRLVPPLYAWWLGVVYFIFGPNIVLAKILQCFMDAFVCPLLYLLARRVTGDGKTALLSALLYAVYPLSIYSCQWLNYQKPLNLALIWIVLCLTAPVTWRNGVWTGLAVAISALAKPVTLPLIAVIPIVKAVECIWRKVSMKVCLVWCLLFAAVCLATLTPWTIRNYLVFHEFVPVQRGGGVPMFHGSKEEYVDLDVGTWRERYEDEIAAAKGNFARVAINNHLEHLRSAPLDYFRFLGKKFLLTWYNTESRTKNTPALLIQSPFLVLAIVGLACAGRLWLKHGNWYLPGMVLYFAAIYVAFHPYIRYMVAVMPLVMVVAAVGGMWLLRKLHLVEADGSGKQ